jgi:phosphatidylglycerol:prolipoprotein diacylglycerol transferase
LFFGFFLSHVLDQIFYHPEEILRRPQSLLFFWEGLSSFGGFVGALVGIFSWKYYDWAERSVGPLRVSFFKRRPEPIPVLPFMDLVIAIFPIGWIFGRTGCSVVHDHPGARVPEPNWLSVAYPLSGEHAKTVSYGPIELVWGSAYRYDLGLVELMFTVLLCVFLVPSWGRALAMGTYLSVIPLAYAPVRFVMDFLRIREGESADRRYGELTFAQWLCIALFMAGIYMALKVCRLHASGSDLTRLVRAPDHTRSVRTFGAAPSSAS